MSEMDKKKSLSSMFRLYLPLYPRMRYAARISNETMYIEKHFVFLLWPNSLHFYYLGDRGLYRID